MSDNAPGAPVDETPVETDNSPRPEDGDQDLPQDPDSVYGGDSNDDADADEAAS